MTYKKNVEKTTEKKDNKKGLKQEKIVKEQKNSKSEKVVKEHKKPNYGLITFICVLIILFIPIISDYYAKKNIETIAIKELNTKIDNQESFILYIGDAEKDVIRKLVNIRNMKPKDALVDYNVYTISTKEVDSSLKKKSVAIYIEGDLQKTYDKFDNKSLINDTKAYFIAEFSKNNTYYKVAENYNAYKKLVNSSDITMAVFGRNSCGWCNKYKPIYNALAEKYNIDIYYFDSDNYNSSEYSKIINMNLVVPAKCNSENQEFKLSEGFGTPLTVFTKKGKVVDCISGYKNREGLISVLKDNNLISE